MAASITTGTDRRILCEPSIVSSCLKVSYTTTTSKCRQQFSSDWIVKREVNRRPETIPQMPGQTPSPAPRLIRAEPENQPRTRQVEIIDDPGRDVTRVIPPDGSGRGAH